MQAIFTGERVKRYHNTTQLCIALLPTPCPERTATRLGGRARVFWEWSFLKN